MWCRERRLFAYARYSLSTVQLARIHEKEKKMLTNADLRSDLLKRKEEPMKETKRPYNRFMKEQMPRQ